MYATESQDEGEGTTNLVRDGGFEAATGAKREGITPDLGEGALKIGSTESQWYFSSYSGSHYNINLEVVSGENVAKSGSNAIKVAPGEVANEVATTVKAGFQQRNIAELTVGKDYLFTTWVKTVSTKTGDTTTGGSLQVKVDNTELISWKTLKNATDWSPFTGEFKAGSTSISKLNFIVQDSSGSGCYWLFDDISIVQVPILTLGNLNLVAGNSSELTVAVDDPHNLLGTTPTYTWSSSAESVATVDAAGKITAVGEGTATITVSAPYETASDTKSTSATCTVTVTEPVIDTAFVKDGSFENTAMGTKADSNDTKIGTNWWISKSSASGLIMNMEIVSEGRTAGTNAMKLSPGSEVVDASKSGKAVLLQHYVTGFDVGKEYIATAYVKAVDTDDGSSFQYYLNGENKNVSSTVYASACRDWTKVTFSFTAKEADTNKYNDQLEFQMSNLDEGYWLLDDISIVQVPIITIDPAEVSLETGDTKEIAVTVDDPHKVLGDAPVITWSSADTEVFTVVEENGKVTLTAKNPGTAKINAISNYADGSGSVKGEWTVKVTPKMIISNGDFAQGTESWTTGTGADVTYTSDAEGRSDNALKVAISDGATGAVSGLFEQLLDTKVTDGLLVNGSKYIVTAYAKPEGANSDSAVTVSWFDSASAIAQNAEIQAGTFTDWIPVTLEFTADDMTASGTKLEVQVSNLKSGYWLFDDISVKNAPYVSIPAEIDIIVGEKAEIDAKIIDLDYILDTAPAFNYSSADTSIAIVDMRGRVTGVSAGTTTITVTNAYDSKYSATCTVTVSAVDLTGIAIPGTLELCEAQQEMLDVTFTPIDATNKAITWTSSDASIAAVDENGLVIGMKAGTATITATGANNLTATCSVTVCKSTTLITKEATIQSTTYQEVVDSFAEFVKNNTSDEATYSLYEEPANGVLTVNEDGSFSYIPRKGQVGDRETFTVIVHAGTEYAFLKGTIELVETIDDSDSDSDTDSDGDSDNDSDTDTDRDVQAPEIVESATDDSYTLGSNEEVTIKTTGDFAKFESVEMDDKIVEETNYTVKEGSTIVTFKPAYLETLSVGEHIVSINYKDGSDVDTKLTILAKADTDNDTDSDTDPNTGSNDTEDNESDTAEVVEKSGDTTGNAKAADATKTGDNSNMGLWLILLGIAVAALSGAGYVFYRKKL